MVRGEIGVDCVWQDAVVPVKEEDDDEGEDGGGGSLDYCPDLGEGVSGGSASRW